MATVCTHEMASCLNRYAQRLGKVMRIHVKVDTGMGRIGVAWQDAVDFIISLQKYPYLKIEGVFTHLSCADTKKQYTREQLRIFNSVLSKVRDSGISIPLVHAANSMGVISYPQSHFTMARPGLMVYGLYPGTGLDISLKPVLSLKSKVVFVKRVPEGCGISYGHTYVTRRETTIVTLPVGYGDGYPRLLSNVGPVLIGGRRFTISGRVCMDQIMVDVGNSRVKVGDPVVLIGAQGNERITAEELACLCDTIPYEIVCGLGSRIPRVYI
jgi:alanine racemase